MKISAGKDIAVLGENERIIGRRAGFDRENLFAMSERAANRAVNLRHAAQTVGILHSRIVLRDATRGSRFPQKRQEMSARPPAGRDADGPRESADRKRPEFL